MADQSTITEEVAVPKVVPMDVTWAQRFKQGKLAADRKRRKRRIKADAHREYSRNGVGKVKD